MKTRTVNRAQLSQSRKDGNRAGGRVRAPAGPISAVPPWVRLCVGRTKWAAAMARPVACVGVIPIRTATMALSAFHGHLMGLSYL